MCECEHVCLTVTSHNLTRVDRSDSRGLVSATCAIGKQMIHTLKSQQSQKHLEIINLKMRVAKSGIGEKK